MVTGGFTVANRTLRIGSTGVDVTRLQTALAALAFLSHAEIGVSFTPATARAVIAFQTRHGLLADGVVGPVTAKALASSVPAEMPAPFESDGAGPSHEDHPPVFAGGWFSGARRFDINRGRIGPAIAPRAVVVHTTDMTPGTMRALLGTWAREAGRGAGAHFLIGKTAAGADEVVPSGGLIQMVPINRNGNHAGGNLHGMFRSKAGAALHPNTWTVGIEIDNAGRMKKKLDGGWVHDSGHVFDDASIFVDEQGHGWEKATEYQLTTLTKLLRALDAEMDALPAGMTVVPTGGYAENGSPWAEVKRAPRIVGHATLTPANKTDPGPEILAAALAVLR